MALMRKKKQNEIEKLFDLEPEEKEKVKEKKVITPEKAEKRRKTKSFFRKLLIIGLPAIIVITAVTLLIVHHVNNSGYRLEVKTVFDLIMTNDDATDLCQNHFSTLSYHGLTYDEYMPKYYMTVKSNVDSVAEKINEESGDIESYKLKFLNSEKLSTSEINDLITGSVGEENESSLKASDFDEVRRLDVELTVTGSKFVTQYMIYNVYAISENGQWKIYVDLSQLSMEIINQETTAD